MQLSIRKVIPYLILLVTVSAVNRWTKVIIINNTYFWWLVYSITLIFFYKGKDIYGYRSTNNTWTIRVFLTLVFISFIQGMFMAEFYWDWKLLIRNLMVFLLPLAVYNYCSPQLLQHTLQIWLKYGLLLFPFLCLVILPESYGRYLIPLSFLTLFFPSLTNKWKLTIMIAVIFIIISSPESRSTVIKFLIPFLMSSIILFQGILSDRFINQIISFITIIFLATPFLLFSLGAMGTFNLFNLSEYLSKDNKYVQSINDSGKTQKLLTDSRTFIYKEEILSAIKKNYWLFGHSMARGYETVAFAKSYKTVMTETKRKERQSCEVSILNIFNYFGVIGVLSYFLIFVFASKNAITKSNNIYIKLVGLYVAFRWMIAWVEDYSDFDMNYLILWMTIGMCFSIPFKQMSNESFQLWLNTMLKKRNI